MYIIVKSRISSYLFRIQFSEHSVPRGFMLLWLSIQVRTESSSECRHEITDHWHAISISICFSSFFLQVLKVYFATTICLVWLEDEEKPKGIRNLRSNLRKQILMAMERSHQNNWSRYTRPTRSLVRLLYFK